MGGCQNYGPSLGTLNIRCRIIIGTQKGTIMILTSTHIEAGTVGCARVERGMGTLRSVLFVQSGRVRSLGLRV